MLTVLFSHALSYYFAVARPTSICWQSFTIGIWSAVFVVSYVRARADDVKVGDFESKLVWFTRVERVIVILVMIIATGLLNQPDVLDAWSVDYSGIWDEPDRLTTLIVCLYCSTKRRGE